VRGEAPIEPRPIPRVALGHFDGEGSVGLREKFQKKYGLVVATYPWRGYLPGADLDAGRDLVPAALEAAEAVEFDLTGNDPARWKRVDRYEWAFGNITNWELWLVLTTPAYLAKTRFWRNGAEVPRDQVLREYPLNQPAREVAA
jgi:hypothetical protein